MVSMDTTDHGLCPGPQTMDRSFLYEPAREGQSEGFGFSQAADVVRSVSSYEHPRTQRTSFFPPGLLAP
jgi:hypothetical protein